MTREKDQPVSVRVTAEERHAWDEAARACGMTRHAWMLAILGAAAGTSALPDHMARIAHAKRP